MTASAAPSTILGPASRPRVLCVDFEPGAAETARRALEPGFEVVGAEHGGRALTELHSAAGSFTAVICDLGAPDVAGMLRESRRLDPEVAHIVLPGTTDPAALAAVVNEAGVFRLLPKPCPPEELARACSAALVARRLRAADRAIVEAIAQGAVQALAETLALASPDAAARGARVRALVAQLLAHLGHDPCWEAEVAALLVHVGVAGLPAETTAKLARGERLHAGEQARVQALPQTASRILGCIPRFEAVLAILDGLGALSGDGDPLPAPLGSRAVRIALDYDLLVSDGAHPSVALSTLRGRAGGYDEALLDAFAEMLGADAERFTVMQIPARRLAVGMKLAADVHNHTGSLLVAAGTVVTEQLLDRLGNVGGGIREPLQVLVPELAPELEGEAVGAGA